jgi:regulator of sigma E protease
MSVVYFLVLLGVLVVIHELGHFSAAVLLGIHVQRFSLGFGRPLVRIRRGETEYQIALLPIGGYVRILGEDPGEMVPREQVHRALCYRPLWQRLTVIFAGPVANLLLPLGIYFGLFAAEKELPATVIGDVLAGTPAASAGIQPGDRVLSVNGETVRYWEDLEQLVQKSIGTELRLDLRRGNREFARYVVPVEHVRRSRDGRESRQGLVGIARDPFLPRVGIVDPASPAARAGLRTGDIVINVDGRDVESWSELVQLLDGARRPNLAYLRGKEVAGFPEIELLEPRVADLVADVRMATAGRLQFVHGLVSAEMFVARVAPGSPAERAGLQPGDLITSLDREPIANWMALDQRLQGRPDRVWEVSWQRARSDGKVANFSAHLRQEREISIDEFGSESEMLVFGAFSTIARGEAEQISIDGRVGHAMAKATERTVETITVMVAAIGSIMRGRDPGRELGGPITMFQVASVSASKGWEAYLLMIALVSVSVGLLNLLPVPILDGGQALLAAIEVVRREPLPARARDKITLAGLAIVAWITVLALKNDVIRYVL